MESQVTSIEASALEALVLENYPEADHIKRLKPRIEFSGSPTPEATTITIDAAI